MGWWVRDDGTVILDGNEETGDVPEVDGDETVRAFAEHTLSRFEAGESVEELAARYRLGSAAIEVALTVGRANRRAARA